MAEEYCHHPKIIRIGASVVLLALEEVARLIGVPGEKVEENLRALEIPKIRFLGNPLRYISMYSLESVLFHGGLPRMFRGDPSYRIVHQELAGVLYGTLTKEVVITRVKEMAKELRRHEAAKKKSKARAG